MTPVNATHTYIIDELTKLKAQAEPGSTAYWALDDIIDILSDPTAILEMASDIQAHRDNLPRPGGFALDSNMQGWMTDPVIGGKDQYLKEHV